MDSQITCNGGADSGGAVRCTDWLGRIVCGDRTEILRSLPPESVDLTVTSPPYNCGKNYGATSDSVPWETYWQQTREWLAEVLRVTKPGDPPSPGVIG